MRYIIAISALTSALLLPQIASTAVLWQDDFENYYEGMPLEESSDWEKIDFGGSFVITFDDWEDDYFAGLEVEPEGQDWALYIAIGGANNPNMKVSAEVDAGGGLFEEYSGFLTQIGIYARLSPEGGGYFARYEASGSFQEWGAEYYYSASLYAFSSELKTSLVTIELPGAIDSISFIASGQNPVHLCAWFDGYNLTYDDYEYNIPGGYSGFESYVGGSDGAAASIDDFLEEEVPANIQPTSLGTIKALYK